ncbi:MAG: tRNA (adenosine(37)-N6)-threonylcarbamoyltransferase complex dimerization subunit type 1 TsaB [Candidatus Cloacimonadales bacterium]|nr:tRNA (adenosine(37)-N6)-threonylcarbamoyltransferase complex dimerization subunit type 1 TsaB [Candidatus Cloacimonadota bacterium]MDD2649685.1 tRNA (adenosine(37)-N6)-threonylcarbamoyltransferase complex dimerization subunit type 1 TsaB [Candidatus Cloacimonadota bacterium]MDX9977507.1 tRNA (adenosine(37)-N6)-threonylcarbamoyltransferase complex dimerization subunit type 1 TsaB [Candidatus Cloacimonadales bacterium]
MTYLSLDTSSNAGSIALEKGGKILYINYFDSLITHSETLMPSINEAFKLAKIKAQDIDAILLANGPGSFTGLRIGLATAKGIAYPHKIPILPFYTLEANAINYMNKGKPILSIIDAKMDEIYLSLYDEHLNEISSPCCFSYPELQFFLEEKKLDNFFLCGDKPDSLIKIFKQNKINYFEQTGILSLKICTSLFSLMSLRKICPEWNNEAYAALEPFYVRKSIAQIRK